MNDDPTVSRRAALAAGAVGAGAVALAACSSSSTGSDKPPKNAALAQLADIEVGKCVSAKLPDGKPAIVSRLTPDTAVAFSARCTHLGCTVAPADTQLHCPCHGSVYNATTGAVIQGPATRALAKIAVQVVGGTVVTA